MCVCVCVCVCVCYGVCVCVSVGVWVCVWVCVVFLLFLVALPCLDVTMITSAKHNNSRFLSSKAKDAQAAV